MLKDKLSKTVLGVACFGEGAYKSKINGIKTPQYKTWRNMLERCYHPEKRSSTYEKCEVCEEWLNFQNFAKWYDENYYEVFNEKMCLDKDILVKGNKVYSPNTCCFVPMSINNLFIQTTAKRGEYPIGVTRHKRDNKLEVSCNIKGKDIYLGRFELNEEEKAFQCYKTFKEKHIKDIADEYERFIPKELYNAMIVWEISITD